jgi:hypothetical protein
MKGLLAEVYLASVLVAGAGFAQDTAHSTGWVVIPVKEYDELHAGAYPTASEPENAPLDATLTRLEYDLHVQNGVASGRATLTVDVLKDGWVRIPVPAGLLVREASLDGKPLSLVGGGAMLSKKGRSVLLLDVALSAMRVGAVEQVSLPAAAWGVTCAKLALAAEPDVELKVSGGILSEESEGEWVAYGSGGPLSFSWKRKTEERRVELPLRMRGSLVELASLGEDSSSINAEVSLEITQGVATEANVRVPEGVTVNQAPGASVADWNVKDGLLTVEFLEPAEHAVSFVIQGEAHLPRDGAVQIPLLRLEDVERETGGVAVELLGPAEMKQWNPLGLETAEASELGPMVAARQSPSLAVYRLRNGAQTRSLSIEVARYAQQAVLTANVEEARYRVLLSAGGKTLVQARYAVRNNQRNFVKIALPTGATVWSSSLEGLPVRPGRGADGSLLFPLSKGRSGEEAPVFSIEVLYLAPSDAWAERGRAELMLPALDLPVSRTGVSVYYPPLYRVSPEPGPFRAQEYGAPESAALNAVTAVTPSGSGGPGGFQGAPAPAQSSQALVDNYRARNMARRPAAPLPLQVAFPAVGPSMFLVSELTGENQAPKVDLTYQKEKRGNLQ